MDEANSSPAARTACVDLPALPLQLVLHDHPKWRTLPVAVVEEDRPQSKITWVNEHARRCRILPGMRFAAARSLAKDLRAEVVPVPRIEDAMGDLFVGLHQFSPRVEPCRSGGTFGFWLDPTGLERLHGSLEQWSRSVHDWLRSQSMDAAVVVGFHRFRTQAVACVHRGHCVIANPRVEARMATSVPLDRLDFPPALRDDLALLEVRSLGEFMALPSAELRLRFGERAEALHHRYGDTHWAPLRPRPLVQPLVARIDLDYAERHHDRLLRHVEPLLAGLLEQLAARGQALSALHVELHLDLLVGSRRGAVHGERLEPAAPTLDVRGLLELVRLRLESRALPADVDGIRLEVEGIRADARQLALFKAHGRRNLEAGERALARLRAAFGAAAVTRAQLVDAHLPEASFTFVPHEGLRFPDALAVREPLPLVRSLLPRPIPLPMRERTEPDGWYIDARQGPVVRMFGPHRVSGGWWIRTVERDYYFAETRRGDLLWIFYDRPRRRWYLHGRVQ